MDEDAAKTDPLTKNMASLPAKELWTWSGSSFG